MKVIFPFAVSLQDQLKCASFKNSCEPKLSGNTGLNGYVILLPPFFPAAEGTLQRGSSFTSRSRKEGLRLAERVVTSSCWVDKFSLGGWGRTMGLRPSNRRDLRGHRVNTPTLHFCFVYGRNSKPFLLPQFTLTVSQNESFPPNTLHYMTVQLFALSLRRSVATAVR